jgi:hypothetical protein
LHGVQIGRSRAESRLTRFQLYCAHALRIGEKEIGSSPSGRAVHTSLCSPGDGGPEARRDAPASLPRCGPAHTSLCGRSSESLSPGPPPGFRASPHFDPVQLRRVYRRLLKRCYFYWQPDSAIVSFEDQRADFAGLPVHSREYNFPACATCM